MPVHDWSKLDAGLFRDFHNAWYAELRAVMNDSLLPDDYYALIEQNAGDILTDVLTLHAPGVNGKTEDGHRSTHAVPVATMPPKVKAMPALPRNYQVPADKQLTIRHVSGDRVVAIIEIVSKGNKSSEDELLRFVIKAAEAIRLGIHLLVVDLHPPTKRDLQGIHGAITAQMGDHGYEAPADKPLTLVSYVAMPIGTPYVEAVGVGDILTSMPLFLDEGHYVDVPLEETYMSAYKHVPRRWKPSLEESISGSAK